MTQPVEKEQLVAEAMSLYAKGGSFRAIWEKLRTRHGDAAPRSHGTIHNWYLRDRKAWDDALDSYIASVAQELSVEGELGRLHAVERKLNRLLAKPGFMSTNEMGEIRTLMALEDRISKRIDPDSMLNWLEVFATWCRDSLPEPSLQVMHDAMQAFGKHVFDMIDSDGLGKLDDLGGVQSVSEEASDISVGQNTT